MNFVFKRMHAFKTLFASNVCRMSTATTSVSRVCHAPIAPVLPLSVPKIEIKEPISVQIAFDVPAAKRADFDEILVPNLNQSILPLNENVAPSLNRVQEYKCYKNLKLTRKFKRHLLHIRHEKMKKHQLRKFRKRMLALIRRVRLQREIKKEKLFRAELLTKIKEAENFDAEKYVNNIFKTIDSKPKEMSKRERFEQTLDLIRKYRSNTHLVKPKYEDPVPDHPYVPKTKE